MPVITSTVFAPLRLLPMQEAQQRGMRLALGAAVQVDASHRSPACRARASASRGDRAAPAPAPSVWLCGCSVTATGCGGDGRAADAVALRLRLGAELRRQARPRLRRRRSGDTVRVTLRHSALLLVADLSAPGHGAQDACSDLGFALRFGLLRRCRLALAGRRLALRRRTSPSPWHRPCGFAVLSASAEFPASAAAAASRGRPRPCRARAATASRSGPAGECARRSRRRPCRRRNRDRHAPDR